MPFWKREILGTRKQVWGFQEVVIYEVHREIFDMIEIFHILVVAVVI